MNVQLQSFGGHLTHAGNIFWLSELSPLDGPEAIRGGVPVIAPRFANLMGGQKHGWARTAEWEKLTPTSAFVENDGLRLTIDVEGDDDTTTVTFTATKVGDEARTLQLGLHPYFLVDDVENIRIDGLTGSDLYEVATDTTTTHTGPLIIRGEFDRIATPADLHSPITCVDPGMGRELELTFTGHDHVVIWNPGVDHNLADVPADQWRNFICIEPALLGHDCVGAELAAGATHTLTMTITVR